MDKDKLKHIGEEMKKPLVFLLALIILGPFGRIAYADCQGCCSWHDGVCCINDVTMCCDGTPLSSTCIAKGCNVCSTPTPPVTSYTQADLDAARQEGYDEGYQAGLDDCESPSCEECEDWSPCEEGFTQAELDDAQEVAYDEGYQAGCASCGGNGCEPATLSPDLNLHIPLLNYQTPFGVMPLWVDFEFTNIDDKLLFEVVDYGNVE